MHTSAFPTHCHQVLDACPSCRCSSCCRAKPQGPGKRAEKSLINRHLGVAPWWTRTASFVARGDRASFVVVHDEDCKHKVRQVRELSRRRKSGGTLLVVWRHTPRAALCGLRCSGRCSLAARAGRSLGRTKTESATMTLCSPFGKPVAGSDRQALRRRGCWPQAPRGPTRPSCTYHGLADTSDRLPFQRVAVEVMRVDHHHLHRCRGVVFFWLRTIDCEHIFRRTPPPTLWHHSVVF